MKDFTNYKFLYGKAQLYDNANVYLFEDKNHNKLMVSEKMGKFTDGSVSRYLLFSYSENEKDYKQYIDRYSDEYKQMTVIRGIVDNLSGDVIQCTHCNTIVLKSQITSSRGDSCVYCDKYACKSCKKILPLIELDDDRLCEKCRKEK